MARAIWQGSTLAESDSTVVVEGNHYFPLDSLVAEHFRPSAQQTTCPWKGTAHYYDLVVNSQINPGAAWFYPEPKQAAANIQDHVAFWRGVQVVP